MFPCIHSKTQGFHPVENVVTSYRETRNILEINLSTIQLILNKYKNHLKKKDKKKEIKIIRASFFLNWSTIHISLFNYFKEETILPSSFKNSATLFVNQLPEMILNWRVCDTVLSGFVTLQASSSVLWEGCGLNLSEVLCTTAAMNMQ